MKIQALLLYNDDPDYVIVGFARKSNNWFPIELLACYMSKNKDNLPHSKLFEKSSIITKLKYKISHIYVNIDETVLKQIYNEII